MSDEPLRCAAEGCGKPAVTYNGDQPVCVTHFDPQRHLEVTRAAAESVSERAKRKV